MKDAVFGWLFLSIAAAIGFYAGRWSSQPSDVEACSQCAAAKAAFERGSK